MRDIDLIPAEYVQARQTRHSVLVFAVVAAALLLGTAAACGWIGLRLGAERKAVEQARQLDAATAALRTRLVALKAAVDSGDAQLAALGRLRDASVSDAWWLALDEAYNPRLWLESLVYARTLRVDSAVATPAGAAAAAPATPPAALPAGGVADPAALALSHALELRGTARDHAAVTEFRRALGEQPGVAAVRLSDSGLLQQGGQDLVAFTVSTTLVAPTARKAPAP